MKKILIVAISLSVGLLAEENKEVLISETNSTTQQTIEAVAPSQAQQMTEAQKKAEAERRLMMGLPFLPQ